jgi:hypothetical protein
LKYGDDLSEENIGNVAYEMGWSPEYADYKFAIKQQKEAVSSSPVSSKGRDPGQLAITDVWRHAAGLQSDSEESQFGHGPVRFFFVHAKCVISALAAAWPCTCPAGLTTSPVGVRLS